MLYHPRQGNLPQFRLHDNLAVNIMVISSTGPLNGLIIGKEPVEN